MIFFEAAGKQQVTGGEDAGQERARAAWRQKRGAGATALCRAALRLWCLLLIPALFAAPARAAQRPFAARFTANTNGNIAVIGNTAMTCSPSGVNGGNCPAARNASGTLTGANLNNNNYSMVYTNLGADPSVDHYSSADFTLPAGNTVLWAGLYWGGEYGNGPGARDRVSFKTPGSGYVSITASQDDAVPNVGCSNSCDRYSAFADVTNLVQAGGSGSYSVGDIVGTPNPLNASNSTYAGWGLVIAYRDSNATPVQPLRNLTVFDGLAEIGCSSPSTVNIPVSGFLTPFNGPVRTVVGVLAGEGDLGSSGDYFALNGTSLSDATRGAGNFFNTSDSDLGSFVSNRYPSYLNLLGWDVARMAANNVLPNGATSANITLGTTAECYYPSMVSFMTDLYTPIIAPNMLKLASDVNGGYLVPGDTLRFTVTVGNTGYDSATGLVLTDNIPPFTSYKPGSLRILSGANAGAMTDSGPGSGEDQAEYLGGGTPRVVFRLGTGANGSTGGMLTQNSFTSLSFDVTVDADIPAGTNISNTASVAYSGQTLVGNTFSDITNPVQVGIMTPPAITKSFSPNPVDIGGVSTMTIQLANPASNVATSTGVSFNDSYPAGMVNDANPNPTISCSAGSTPGTVTGAVAGSSSIGMTNATILQNGVCTVTVRVKSNLAQQGNYTNAIAAVTTANAGTGPGASAVFSVGTPTVSESFTPAVIAVNGSSTLRFTLSNSTAVTLTDVAFADLLAGLQVASPANVVNSCGGSVAAVPGSSSVSLSGGTLPAASGTLAGSCTVSVAVTGASAGYFVNSLSGGITASAVGTTVQSPPGNSASLTVNAPVGAAMGFYPPSIYRGGDISLLTITLMNPNLPNAAGSSTVTGVAFSDLYPANLVNTANPTPVLSCTAGSSATLTGGTAGGSGIGLSGGTLRPGGSCTLTVYVTSSTAANYTNSTGIIASANAGSGAAASAVLNVSALTPPTLGMSFSPASIATVPAGGSSALTITLSNANSTIITGLAFGDTLPAGMSVAGLPGTPNSCGGTLSAPVGGSALSLTGGSIPANGSCSVTVNVTAAAAGAYFNSVPQAITANAGVASQASATFYVLAPPLVAKSFTPDAIYSGGSSTLSFTLTNPAGNMAALTGVALSDTLLSSGNVFKVASTPALVNGCGGSVTGASSGSRSIAISGVTLPPNASCTVSLAVTATTGNYPNTTSAVNSANGGTGLTASATLSVAHPSIDKSFAPGSIASGESSVLTITLTNPSTSTLSGATFTDLFPAGLAVDSPVGLVNGCGGNVYRSGSTSALAPGDGSLTLVNGSIPRRRNGVNGSCSIRLNVTASATAQNEIPAYPAPGYLSVNGPDYNVVPAQATLSVYPVPTGAKSFTPASIGAGSDSRITVTLNNPNGFDATGVAFTDSYPSGLVNAATPGALSSCGGSLTATPGGNSLRLTGAVIPARESCTVTVDVTGASAGSYTNPSFQVTTANAGPATVAPALLTVLQPPAVSASFTPSRIGVNGSALLTITLTNPNAAADIQLASAGPGFAMNDLYPAGLVNSATPGAATSCPGAGVSAAPGGGSLVLSGGAIPANGSCSVTVNVTSAALGNYSNATGEITTLNASSVAAPGASAALAVVLPAPAVAKSFTPGQILVNVPAGSSSSLLTVTLTNPNAGAITGAAFTDSYPAGLVNSATPGAASTGCGSPVVSAAPGGSSLSLSGASIAGGGSCSVTVNVTSASAGGYTNSIASVTSSNAGTGGPASAPLIVVLPGPTAAQSFTPATVGVGRSSVLTITLNNPNAAAITGVAFSDLYPAGLVNSATPGANSTCGGTPAVAAAAGGASLTLSGASIPANGSCTVTVNVTSAAAGSFPNSTGQIASSNAALGSAASATLTVSGTRLSKGFAPATVVTGQSATANFTIANGTGNPAQGGLAFSDTLPAGLQLSGAATPSQCGGTLSYDTVSVPNRILFSGGQLAAGSASCAISATVSAAAAGSYTNASANVTGLAGGLSATGLSALITVIPPATLTKGFAPATVAKGQPATLSFTINNGSGNPSQSGLGFTDTLPAGLSVANPPNAVSSCGGSIFRGGSAQPVAPGDGALTFSGGALSQASCSVSVQVTGAGAGSYLNGAGNLTALAGGLLNGVTDQLLTVIPNATLSKSFTPASIDAFQKATLSFDIANPAGNPPQTGLSFTDTLPGGGSLVLATPPSFASSCGGALYKAGSTTPVTGGESAFTLSGASVAGGAPAAGCTASLQVTSSVPGNYLNNAANLSALGGGLAPLAGMGATLSVQAPDPALTKSFTGSPVLTGAPSRLSFTITNGQGNLAQGGLGFTDSFPAGLVVANPPNLSITPAGCGGALYRGGSTTAVAAGDGAVSYQGGSMAAGTATCSIALDVTSATAGTYLNSAANGNLSAAAGNLDISGAAATLAVNNHAVLTKAFGAATIAAGTGTTLGFTIANGAGNPQQTGLGFTDTLPAGLSVTGAAPSQCGGTVSFGAGWITLAGGRLAAGAPGSCAVTATVTGSTPGSYTNGAAQIGALAGGVLNGVSNQTLTVAAAPTLASSPFTPALIGVNRSSTLSYTITNNGSGNPTLSGLGFTTNLPAGLSITSAASSQCGGSVSFTAASLSVTGATLTGASCTVSATVTAGTPGSYAIKGSDIPAASLTGGLINAVAQQDLTVSAPTLTTAFAPGTIGVGATQSSTLGFTVSNGAGNPAQSGFGFRETLPPLPAGLAFSGAASSSCGGTVSYTGGNVLNFSGGSLAAGAAGCSITAPVSSSAAGVFVNGSGNLDNLAGGLQNGVTSQTLTVAGTTLGKAFAPAGIVAGLGSTLTLTIVNGSGDPAQAGLSFTDTLPAGVVLAAAPAASQCAGSVSGSAGGNSITLTGGQLPLGSHSCSVSAAVTSSAAGGYLNNAANIGVPAQSPVDASGASALLTVSAAAALTKSFAPASITTGLTSTVTFRISNGTGNPAQSGLAFSDALPAGLSLVGAASSPQCGGSVAFDTSATPHRINFSGGSLAAGTAGCSITATVTSNTAGNHLNDSSRVTGLAGGLRATGVNATLSVVNSNPTLSKGFSPAIIGAGKSSTLTFFINNGNGNPAQSGLAFTDTLPAGLHLAGSPIASQCGGTLSYSTASEPHKINFTGGSLASGSTGCSVSATVTAADPGSYRNYRAGNISNLAPTGTPSLDASGVDATLTVQGTSLTKAFAPAAVGLSRDSAMTFTINNGADNPAQSGIGFTETLPPGVLLSGTPVSPQCGGSVSYDTASLPNRVIFSGQTLTAGTASCNLATTVTSDTAGSYSNTSANISALAGGLTAAGMNATLTVLAPPTASAAFLTNPIGAGGISTLSVTLSNPNGADITQVFFTDLFPSAPGQLAVAATPAISNGCGGSVSTPGNFSLALTGATIPANGSCTVTVQVTASVPGSYMNQTGAIGSANAGSGPAAACSLTVVAARIDISFQPVLIGVGGTSTLSLSIANGAGFPAQSGLGFTDTLPAGVSVSGASASQCGGSVSFLGNSVTLSGGSLAPGTAGCSITATVRGDAAGSYLNEAADLSALSGGLTADAAGATLTVAGSTLAKAFAPAAIIAGQSSTLSFTIANGPGLPLQTGLAFTETLPPGVSFSAASPSQCGGSVSFTAASLTLNGGTLASGTASCTVTATVTSSISNLYLTGAGNLSALSAGLDGSAASAVLSVTALPNIIVLKTVQNHSDPVNGQANPRAIPGGQMLYTLLITNSGRGVPDPDTIVITDPIPPHTSLMVTATPVSFADGSPSSGLSVSWGGLASLADDVQFSNNGGLSFDYVPIPGPNGADAAVTHLRVTPRGSFNASDGSNNPNFSITFKVIIN